MSRNTRFASYPSAQVYEAPDGKKSVQHLLWGDWLRIKSTRKNGYVAVRARGVDGWMREEDFQKERLLEVAFMDVGQGDGALIVTPDDRHMVIDAGKGDNMRRFLSWRYGGFEEPFKFDAAILSHPDEDHYGGFNEIFDIQNATFETLYHNGIVERKSPANPLGKRKKTGRGKPSFLTDLIKSNAELDTFLSVPSRWTGKRHPTLLQKARENRRFKRLQMLEAGTKFLPGFGPGNALNIAVLGPVLDNIDNNDRGLRWFGSKGKTKNGHSIVLKATYNKVRILLGGDLNIPAEKHLLHHHTGLDPSPDSIEDQEALIASARNVFTVDIAKACHHGSADFSSLFLRALNPIATVISSGDNESHAHPRADAIGAIGKTSRGGRPLVFSTELARSFRDQIKHPAVLRQTLKDLQSQIDETEVGRKKTRLIKRFNGIVNSLDRSVAVFGTIQLRTDGNKVVMAYKLEREKRQRGKLIKWDIYELDAKGTNGALRYQSKHDH